MTEERELKDPKLRKMYGMEENIDQIEEIPPMSSEKTYGFYLRFAHKTFIPCKHCQEKIDSIMSTCDLTLGNRDYDPPVELWRKYETVRSD